jgi:small multidrug resistance pump
MKTGWYLVIAIVAEVVETTGLKLSDGMTKPGWLALVAFGYGGAFYALSLAMRHLPIGLSYAVWSGAGTVLTLVIGRVVFGERIATPQLVGAALVVGGIATIQLFGRQQL